MPTTRVPRARNAGWWVSLHGLNFTSDIERLEAPA
jgi:hypothetical protein